MPFRARLHPETQRAGTPASEVREPGIRQATRPPAQRNHGQTAEQSGDAARGNPLHQIPTGTGGERGQRRGERNGVASFRLRIVF